MSSIVGTILRSSITIRSVIPCRPMHLTQVHNLYSASALGIDGFLLSKKRVKEHFQSYSDKFKNKIEGFVNEPESMIFTEDLKNMIHIAEHSDIKLVQKMIKKFNTQSESRFGSFIFGPVVMRMFHCFDAPKEALECFYDPVNRTFFEQLVSYQILLDLLYNNEMYEEMYKLFDTVKERQTNMLKFPKYLVTLILAACYRQNTPQSMEYASKLWAEMIASGTTPLRRAASYFAALALNQNAPLVALEALALQTKHYVTVRNINAMALADMGRLDDAFLVLKQVLEIDRPDQMDKHTFFKETIERVKQAVDKANNKDLQKELKTIENALKERNLIDDHQTLDQLLRSEIKLTKNVTKNDGKRSFPKRDVRLPSSRQRQILS